MSDGERRSVERQPGNGHEAAHAVVARHYGYDVPELTMTYARIPHREYHAPDDPDSIKRLLVSCAGNAATLHARLPGLHQNRDGGRPLEP